MTRTSKGTAKPKKGFLDGYKTYDTSKGYGSPDDWRGAFRERMGFEEAQQVMGDDSPLGILGLAMGATWDAIKAAYRRLALEWHPDRNHSPEAMERMKKINAAFTVLEHDHRR